MNVVLVLAVGMVMAHGVLCVIRLLRGPSIADRVVALDNALLAVGNAIGIHALWTGTADYIDIILVTALLAFVGTVTVARFIEDRR